MIRLVLALPLCFTVLTASGQEHDHPVPEKLGTVSFPISCNPEVQQEFNRAVALLHSFAYKAAEEGFQTVVRKDPQCAIARWGEAMTHFHQLWDLPPAPADMSVAQAELKQGAMLDGISERERGYLNALSLIFKDAPAVPYQTRALSYEAAMRGLAEAHPKDVEAQVFYALA